MHRLAGHASSDRFSAIAHTAKTHTLFYNPAATVVADIELIRTVDLSQLNPTMVRLRVPYDIGHRLPQRQSQDALLRCGNLHAFAIVLYCYASGMKCCVSALKFHLNAAGVITADGFAHFGQCLPRDSLDVGDLGV